MRTWLQKRVETSLLSLKAQLAGRVVGQGSRNKVCLAAATRRSGVTENETRLSSCRCDRMPIKWMRRMASHLMRCYQVTMLARGCVLQCWRQFGCSMNPNFQYREHPDEGAASQQVGSNRPTAGSTR